MFDIKGLCQHFLIICDNKYCIYFMFDIECLIFELFRQKHYLCLQNIERSRDIFWFEKFSLMVLKNEYLMAYEKHQSRLETI